MHNGNMEPISSVSSKGSEPDIVNDKHESRTPSFSKALSKLTSDTFLRKKKSIGTPLITPVSALSSELVVEDPTLKGHRPDDQIEPIPLTSPCTAPRLSSFSRSKVTSFLSSSDLPTTQHSSSGSRISRRLSTAVAKTPFLSRFSNITAPVDPSVVPSSSSYTGKSHGPSITIPEHKLMAPLPPPLPRSKTYGALPNDEHQPFLPKTPSYARGTSSSQAKTRGKSPIAAGIPVPGHSRQYRPSHAGSAMSTSSHRKTPRSSVLDSPSPFHLNAANSSRVSLANLRSATQATGNQRSIHTESAAASASSSSSGRKIPRPSILNSATSSRVSLQAITPTSRGNESRRPSYAESATESAISAPSSSSSRMTPRTSVLNTPDSSRVNLMTKTTTIRDNESRRPSYTQSAASASSSRKTPHSFALNSPNSQTLNSSASSSALNDPNAFIPKTRTSFLNSPNSSSVSRSTIRPRIRRTESRHSSSAKMAASTSFHDQIPSPSVLNAQKSSALNTSTSYVLNDPKTFALNDANSLRVDLTNILPAVPENRRQTYGTTRVATPATGRLQRQTSRYSDSGSAFSSGSKASYSLRSNPSLPSINIASRKTSIEGMAQNTSGRNTQYSRARKTPSLPNLTVAPSRRREYREMMSGSKTPTAASPYPVRKTSYGSSQAKMNPESNIPTGIDLPPRVLTYGNSRLPVYMNSRSPTPEAVEKPSRKTSSTLGKSPMSYGYSKDEDVPPVPPLPAAFSGLGDVDLPQKQSRTFGDWYAESIGGPRSLFKQPDGAEGRDSDNDVGPPVPPKSPDKPKAGKGPVGGEDYSDPRYVSTSSFPSVSALAILTIPPP